jgi:hypothetical protein
MRIDMKEQSFGVEIETESLGREGAVTVLSQVLGGEPEYSPWFKVRDDQGRDWKVVRDGSLGSKGAEIVTPILNYSDIDTVSKIVRALREAGAKVPKTCGLHIHVGFGSEDKPADAFQMANLVKIVNKQEEYIFAAFGVTEQRKRRYCQPMPEELVEFCSTVKPGAKLSALSFNPFGNRIFYDRYHGLNTLAYSKHQTVEFRYFNGTLNPDKIISYIQFCLAVTAYARNASKARKGRRAFNAASAAYDFRVFLTSIGLNGKEFATCRAVLTARLDGDKAFKFGRDGLRAAA